MPMLHANLVLRASKLTLRRPQSGLGESKPRLVSSSPRLGVTNPRLEPPQSWFRGRPEPRLVRIIVNMFCHKSHKSIQTSWLPFISLRHGSRGPWALKGPPCLSRVQAWRPQAKPGCKQAWAWGPRVEVTKAGLGWPSLGLAALRIGLVCIGTIFCHEPCNMSTRTSWVPFTLCAWSLEAPWDLNGHLALFRV